MAVTPESIKIKSMVRNQFWCILALKSHIWWKQFTVRLHTNCSGDSWSCGRGGVRFPAGTGTPHRQLNCWAALILFPDAASQRCCAARERRLRHRHRTVNQQPGQWRCTTMKMKLCVVVVLPVVVCWTTLRLFHVVILCAILRHRRCNDYVRNLYRLLSAITYNDSQTEVNNFCETVTVSSSQKLSKVRAESYGKDGLRSSIFRAWPIGPDLWYSLDVGRSAVREIRCLVSKKQQQNRRPSTYIRRA